MKISTLRSLALLALPLAALPAAAGSLSTLYAADNSGGNGWSVFFDVTALASPLSVTALAVNMGAYSAAASGYVSTPGVAFSIEVYTKPGNAYPNWNIPSLWTLRATGTGTTAALNAPSAAALSAPFTIPVGTSGFAVRYTSAGGAARPVYTNATSGNTTYSNADMRIVGDASSDTSNGPFTGDPVHGEVFSGRIWNGTINYNPVPEPSALAALALPVLTTLRRRKRA